MKVLTFVFALTIAALPVCANAGVERSSLMLAHDADSAATLNITVTKDVGDALVSGEVVVFRLESRDSSPLINGGSYYYGTAFFYNNFNGFKNVYELTLNLYDRGVLDQDPNQRVNFFVNLKNTNLVFYNYANGVVNGVAGTLDMALVCDGTVRNLSGANKCNISASQVINL